MDTVEATAAMAGWQQGAMIALALHAGLTLAALWPARRLLVRAGLPISHALWLVVPVLGWAVFSGVLALKPWPALPPRPERLHPREALRRARATKQGG